MSVFLTIIFALPLLDLLWWWSADRLLRGRGPISRWGRPLVAAVALFQFLGYAWIIGSRFADIGFQTPPWLLAALYIWHLVVLPLTAVAWLLLWPVPVAMWWTQRRAARRGRPVVFDAAPTEPAPLVVPSRRQFLATAAAMAPPIVLAGAMGRAIPQLNEFRINRITIPLASLPPDLDGLTIAHLSDVHVGRFTRARMLPAIVEATNQLRTDLVLMTGDLIDFSIADLPAATDMVRRFDPHHGLFTVEGNHDLFDGRDAFERGVRSAGIPLLLNQSASAIIRGIDVQILGTGWGRGGPARPPRGAAYEENTMATLAQMRRDRGVFPILLSHHPHAFDLAAEAGVPLTLSGHTHGGQLMLGPTLGPGPLMYKYWSGLYRKGDPALVVSNGVGNWFPLRINAPAEIVHITLRKA